MTVLQGSNATFSVTANGTQPLNYQWSFGGTNVAGVTNSFYTLSNVQTNNAGTYSVTITNQLGSVSTNAVLTVLAPPFIALQPTNVAVKVGSNVVFSVTAGGTTPLSYRWPVSYTHLQQLCAGPEPVECGRGGILPRLGVPCRAVA